MSPFVAELVTRFDSSACGFYFLNIFVVRCVLLRKKGGGQVCRAWPNRNACQRSCIDLPLSFETIVWKGLCSSVKKGSIRRRAVSFFYYYFCFCFVTEVFRLGKVTKGSKWGQSTGDVVLWGRGGMWE